MVISSSRKAFSNLEYTLLQLYFWSKLKRNSLIEGNSWFVTGDGIECIDAPDEWLKG